MDFTCIHALTHPNARRRSTVAVSENANKKVKKDGLVHIDLKRTNVHTAHNVMYIVFVRHHKRHAGKMCNKMKD